MSTEADFGVAGHPRAWIFWHPHQRLWNWRAVSICRRLFGSGFIGEAMVVGLIGVDSAVLMARVLARRTRHLYTFLRNRPKSDAPATGPPVLYIDCGLHRRGEQVLVMQEWFGERYDLQIVGFEASEEHFRSAAAALSDIPQVRLHQIALVGPDHGDPTIRLYKAGGEGKGDSLFGARGGQFELVPAHRLSEFLEENGYDFGFQPVLLRMNIEGAERFVIDDLVDAGLVQSIDGFYGMWDDLSKIDTEADRRFRAVLRREGISTLTFNDRDLTTHRNEFNRRTGAKHLSSLRSLVLRGRERLIRCDMETSIRLGLSRTRPQPASHRSAG